MPDQLQHIPDRQGVTMDQAPLYRTSLSLRVRRSLILYLVSAVFLTLMTGALWYYSGEGLHGVLFIISAVIIVIVVTILIRARYPLELYSGHLVLNGLTRAVVPLSGVSAFARCGERGILLTRKCPGEQHSRSMHIRCRIMGDARDDILAQLETALQRAR